MYAIVEIAGEQFRVRMADTVTVPLLNKPEGETVEFSNVLLLGGDGDTKIGAPYVAGARVSAMVLGTVRGDKVIVFKKKKRKGYRKLNGHRQSYSTVRIEGIFA